MKEDPKTKGLLFAGSERFVNVSFDDGDNWQSIKLNMPPTSIRDLVIKDDDVVVGTHGRSFWILDNITPLRQLKSNPVRVENPDRVDVLFQPQTAYFKLTPNFFSSLLTLGSSAWNALQSLITFVAILCVESTALFAWLVTGISFSCNMSKSREYLLTT